jgi:hypothetical protein
MYNLQSFSKSVFPIMLSLPIFMCWAKRSVIITYFHSTIFETSAPFSHKLSSGNAIGLQFYQLTWLNIVRKALKLRHTTNFSSDQFSCVILRIIPVASASFCRKVKCFNTTKVKSYRTSLY